MTQKPNELLKQVADVFFGSRKAAVISMLFIVAVSILSYAMYQEMRKPWSFDQPMGREEEQQPRMDLHELTEILILNSYHMGHAFPDNEMKGIIETLKKASPKIQLRIEYLDTKYFPKR